MAADGSRARPHLGAARPAPEVAAQSLVESGVRLFDAVAQRLQFAAREELVPPGDVDVGTLAVQPIEVRVRLGVRHFRERLAGIVGVAVPAQDVATRATNQHVPQNILQLRCFGRSRRLTRLDRLEILAQVRAGRSVGRSGPRSGRASSG